jgi:hypothetical protein
MGTIALFTFNAAELKANENSLADSSTISFTETVHDFGTIKKGSDGTCDFTFKNTGKIPLVLSNVQSTCGCTVPSWPKEPIAPGKTGEIKVKYNTNNVGGFQKGITVYSNAKTVVLTIKGTVQE